MGVSCAIAAKRRVSGFWWWRKHDRTRHADHCESRRDCRKYGGHRVQCLPSVDDSQMTWRIPFSGVNGVAHLFRTDGAGHARILCSGAYTNAAIASDGADAPHCLLCVKVTDARDRRLALQESWSLPA